VQTYTHLAIWTGSVTAVIPGRFRRPSSNCRRHASAGCADSDVVCFGQTPGQKAISQYQGTMGIPSGYRYHAFVGNVALAGFSAGIPDVADDCRSLQPFMAGCHKPQ